ncbi:hypothetical protein K438DRAFT_1998178 [Mycena galopus ATCC 62051]|nr:hypothetical protein K438DRAFT_1998178 [Mycena galopus ATCC 62051]
MDLDRIQEPAPPYSREDPFPMPEGPPPAYEHPPSYEDVVVQGTSNSLVDQLENVVTAGMGPMIDASLTHDNTVISLLVDEQPDAGTLGRLCKAYAQAKNWITPTARSSNTKPELVSIIISSTCLCEVWRWRAVTVCARKPDSAASNCDSVHCGVPPHPRRPRRALPDLPRRLRSPPPTPPPCPTVYPSRRRHHPLPLPHPPLLSALPPFHHPPLPADERSYGELDAYPLRRTSLLCKPSGGGRWEPEPEAADPALRVPVIDERSYGELDAYPMHRPSLLCKASGGGRWEPKPGAADPALRVPVVGGKPPYELEMEHEMEREKAEEKRRCGFLLTS